SAGCMFRNPDGVSAGLLVDRAGLKGRARGGAQVSEIHGNFVVNRGGASASDVLGLVDEVRAEVIPDAGALPRLLAPACAHLGAIAVEMRFDVHRLADGATGQRSAQGEEIAVPAAVLEHRQQPPRLPRHTRQVPRLRQRDGERLVDHHVLARTQRRLGQRRVLVIRRRDHDQIGLRMCGRRVRRADQRLGPIRADGLRAIGAHHMQAQPGRGGNQRGVEQLAGISVTHQGNTETSRRMC
ncbi:MAG: hypothetical protein JSV72_16155, partial [Ralstonia sp.]